MDAILSRHANRNGVFCKIIKNLISRFAKNHSSDFCIVFPVYVTQAKHYSGIYVHVLRYGCVHMIFKLIMKCFAYCSHPAGFRRWCLIQTQVRNFLAFFRVIQQPKNFAACLQYLFKPPKRSLSSCTAVFGQWFYDYAVVSLAVSQGFFICCYYYVIFMSA